MAQQTTPGYATWLDQHIQLLVDEGRTIDPGQGTSSGSAKTSYTSRIGRYADGTYYADVAWRTMEGYGDDPMSQRCWCRLNRYSHQHRHRTASTIVGLLTAETKRGAAR